MGANRVEFGILRAVMSHNRCMAVIRGREYARREWPMGGWNDRVLAVGHRYQHTYRT